MNAKNAKLSKYVLVLFLSLFLAACSEDKALPAQKSAEAFPSATAETPAITESPAPPAPSPAVTAAPAPDSKEETQPLQKYTDAVHGDMRGDLLFSAKQDLDLDGYDEIVLGYGDLDKIDPQYSDVWELHVLRDRDGEIEELAHDFEGGYQKRGFKLIRLQDLQQTFIYCDLTNEAGMTGFAVLEISGDQVLRRVYSAAANGKGEDYISDSNGDGQYDSYVQYRKDYSTFEYSLDRTYEMEEGEFVLKETKVGIPGYPQEIKDVILQYLSLSALEAEQSPETDERLAELRIDKDGAELSEEELYTWRDSIIHTMEGYSSEIQFDIKEDGLGAEAALTYSDPETLKEDLEMHLHLIRSAAGWQIDDLN